MRTTVYLAILSVGSGMATLFVAPSVAACENDEDSVRRWETLLKKLTPDAAGKISVRTLRDVLTGNFLGEPPEYHLARIRVMAPLAERSEELDGATLLAALERLDNLGVSCDRLKRGDEAIAWMEMKRPLVDKLPEGPEKTKHLYRYYANMGTFHAHRWAHAGMHRDAIEDLKRAKELVHKAIEVNPEGHMGREKYQLIAIEWLLDPGLAGCDETAMTVDANRRAKGAEILPAEYPANPTSTAFAPTDYMEAVGGLAGLVLVGNGWTSPDIFAALHDVLTLAGLPLEAELARLRLKQLGRSGKKPLNGCPNLSAVIVKRMLSIEAPKTPPAIDKLSGQALKSQAAGLFMYMRGDANSKRAEFARYFRKINITKEGDFQNKVWKTWDRLSHAHSESEPAD